MLFVKRLLPLCLLAALSGCDLGSGSKLESLEIVGPTGATLTPPYQLYQCFRDRLNVIGRFSNGDVGNFSSRVTWSSTVPGTNTPSNVVRVLNNGEQNTRAVISGQFADVNGLTYTAGVLVPKGVGTATITASFLGLTATMDVTVSAPTLAISQSPLGVTINPATGVGFSNTFTVRAVTKGKTIDAVLRRQDPSTLELLNPILWQFQDNVPGNAPMGSFSAGNPASTISLDREDLNLFPAGSTRTTGSADSTSEPLVAGTQTASINPASGVFRAVKTNTTKPTILAIFDTDPALGVSCPTPSVSLQVPVGALVAQPNLTLSHEAGFTGDLVIPTDESLKTVANLDTDGDNVADATQDVSGQVGYEVVIADRDACLGSTDCTVDANRASSILTFTFNKMTTVPGTNGSFCDSASNPGRSNVPRFTCQTANPTVDTVKVRACAPTCSSTTPTATSNELPIRAIPATLTSIGPVSPPAATETAFTFPGRQFQVFATFTATNTTGGCFGGTDANPCPGSGIAGTQNVSRYMSWVARPAGSTDTVSDVVNLFGLYSSTLNSGESYYLRNPTTAESPVMVDITATPATSTLIGAFTNASTLTVTPASLTINRCTTADTTGVCP